MLPSNHFLTFGETSKFCLGDTSFSIIGVGVSVSVSVSVGVGVGVGIGVGIGVDIGIGDGIGVGISVGVGDNIVVSTYGQFCRIVSFREIIQLW